MPTCTLWAVLKEEKAAMGSCRSYLLGSPFAGTGEFMSENLAAPISKEEVQSFYEQFLQMLKSGDITLLERIYAEVYQLVRPNGETPGKKEILADLCQPSMRFLSFDVSDVLIRTKGLVGTLTAAVRSRAVRDGVEIKTYARQLAIVSKENGRITIFHFQSTNIADR
jgi:hypothetical protein